MLWGGRVTVNSPLLPLLPEHINIRAIRGPAAGDARRWRSDNARCGVGGTKEGEVARRPGPNTNLGNGDFSGFPCAPDIHRSFNATQARRPGRMPSMIHGATMERWTITKGRSWACAEARGHCRNAPATRSKLTSPDESPGRRPKLADGPHRGLDGPRSFKENGAAGRR